MQEILKAPQSLSHLAGLEAFLGLSGLRLLLQCCFLIHILVPADGGQVKMPDNPAEAHIINYTKGQSQRQYVKRLRSQAIVHDIINEAS